MLPELARPGLMGPSGAADSSAAGQDTIGPESASSGGDPALAAPAVAADVKDLQDKPNGKPDPVRSPGKAAEVKLDNDLTRRIDVRVLSSRIKRTYKYADVRLCEFHGLGPRAVVQDDDKDDPEVVAKQLSSIRIKITTPEATEFDLDTFDENDEDIDDDDDDDEKPNADDK